MHLYLHIPFCRQACHYCDFHFSTQLKLKNEVVKSLCQEIYLQRNYLRDSHLTSIYFGGGTPSLLEKDDFDLIFKTIRQYFTISSRAEITLEANPDDLTKAKIQDFKETGINRLSIGIQSFDENNLKFLNRIHRASEAENSVKLAQDMGIENISVDLIYAISPPNVSTDIEKRHDVWHHDLAKAISLDVPHISSYCLTIEPKTVFGKRLKMKRLAPIEDTFAAEQFQILTKTLASNQYEQYEISNFCQPEMYARHNSSYWKQHEYLGIGPSAHSFNGKSRQHNIANNAQYIKSISANIIPCEVELLTNFDKVNDYILTTLRTKWGCNLAEIKNIIGEKWEQENGMILKKYVQARLLILDNQVVALTEEGKLFADKIAADLFLVE